MFPADGCAGVAPLAVDDPRPAPRSGRSVQPPVVPVRATPSGLVATTARSVWRWPANRRVPRSEAQKPEPTGRPDPPKPSGWAREALRARKVEGRESRAESGQWRVPRSRFLRARRLEPVAAAAGGGVVQNRQVSWQKISAAKERRELIGNSLFQITPERFNFFAIFAFYCGHSYLISS